MTERRLGPSTSSSSIKLPSPAPASAYAPTQRSRLSHQTHPRQSPTRARRGNSLFGADEDAEGEDDYEENGDENGDPEDKEIYCFCQKLSYGEVNHVVARPIDFFSFLTALSFQMIACDNPDCQYQWVGNIIHLWCCIAPLCYGRSWQTRLDWTRLPDPFILHCR